MLIMYSERSAGPQWASGLILMRVPPPTRSGATRQATAISDRERILEAREKAVRPDAMLETTAMKSALLG